MGDGLSVAGGHSLYGDGPPYGAATHVTTTVNTDLPPRGIENNMKALSDAGIRVVVISVDKPEKTRVKMVQEAGYTFTFLSDPQL